MATLTGNWLDYALFFVAGVLLTWSVFKCDKVVLGAIVALLGVLLHFKKVQVGRDAIGKFSVKGAEFSGPITFGLSLVGLAILLFHK